MSVHLTVAQAMTVGFAAGACIIGALCELKATAMRDQLDEYRRGNADLAEELEDMTAERDGFRMHLDGVIDCELGQPDPRERAIAYHPAGGRRGTWQPQEDRAVRDHLKLVSGGQP